MKFTVSEDTDSTGTVWYEFQAFPDEFLPEIDEQLQWCEERWEGEPTEAWKFSLQEIFAREYAVERGGGVTPVGGLEPLHWMFTIRTRNGKDAMVFKLQFC